MEQGTPMRIGILSSVVALLAGVGPALSQVPVPAATVPAATSSPAAAEKPAAAVEAAKPKEEAPKASTVAAAAEQVAMPAEPPHTLAPNFGAAPASPARPVIPAPTANGCATGNCGNGACGAGNPCSDVPIIIGNRFYGSAEYILYKIQSAPLPPTQLTIPFTVSGLNLFTSTINFGGTDVELDGRSGGRFTVGYWCHSDQLLGIEATYFQLERRQQGFGGTQVADLPLNLTVIQNITTVSAVAATITQVPLNVTLPAELSVASKGATGTNSVWGAEINARSTRCIIGGAALDVLGGFRYLDFEEQLTLSEGILLSVANPINLSGPGPIPPNPLPPIPQPVTGLRPLASLSTFDQISTRNRFYGPQIGASADWWVSERLVLGGWAKFAAGAMVQDVNLTGFTTTSASPTGGATITTTTPGGLLTPGAGFVTTSRTRVAVIPELNLNVGLQITPHIRAMVGYDFLYISSLARPGDQVGFTASTTSVSIAGAATTVHVNTPAINFHDTDMWLQGLTAGFQIRY